MVPTHGYRFVCGSWRNFIKASLRLRKQVFIKRRLFVPDGNRCCQTHFIKNILYEDYLIGLYAQSNSSKLEPTEVKQYLEWLSNMSESPLRLEIGDLTLSPELLKAVTELTWYNIDVLRKLMTSIKNSSTKHVIVAIVIFLFKLRTGNSNAVLLPLLDLKGNN